MNEKRGLYKANVRVKWHYVGQITFGNIKVLKQGIFIPFFFYSEW